MTKGKPWSEEIRKKLSEAHKGKHSPMKGKHYSKKIRKKMSLAQKKRFANPEERKKIGEFFKGKHPKSEFKKGHNPIAPFKKGNIPWNKGKTGIYSEETRRKIGLAGKGRIPWMKGKHQTAEAIEKQRKSWMKTFISNPKTRQKMSESHKGQIPTNLEQLRRLSIGHKVSEETRRKISQSKKGWHPSKEAIEKNRLAHLGKPAWNKGIKMPEISGERHPMFGKTHSEESKLKMSASHKKQMFNPEFRKKLSEIHKKRLSNPKERERQSKVSRETILSLYESNSFPRQTDTKPERQIKAELIKRGYKEGIDFVHQYKFMNKFMCDFCFPKQKVVVEAYGDFWHANPKKYLNQANLHVHQIKGIGRDKSKEGYITTVDNRSWTFLILWESDIKKDVSKCVDLIEQALKKTKQTGVNT